MLPLDSVQKVNVIFRELKTQIMRNNLMTIWYLENVYVKDNIHLY
jgi:hypothetical protein